MVKSIKDIRGESTLLTFLAIMIPCIIACLVIIEFSIFMNVKMNDNRILYEEMTRFCIDERSMNNPERYTAIITALKNSNESLNVADGSISTDSLSDSSTIKNVSDNNLMEVHIQLNPADMPTSPEVSQYVTASDGVQEGFIGITVIYAPLVGGHRPIETKIYMANETPLEF